MIPINTDVLVPSFLRIIRYKLNKNRYEFPKNNKLINISKNVPSASSERVKSKNMETIPKNIYNPLNNFRVLINSSLSLMRRLFEF